MNGRIDLNQSRGVTHGLYQEGCDLDKFTDEAMRGTGIDPSSLSRLFFSKMNFDALQDGIRYLVFKQSKGEFTISNQSKDDLLTVMRSIFLQNSRNLEIDLVAQTKELNGLVLEFCVPRIMSEIRMYKSYREEIQTLPVPMNRSTSESVKGTKSVEFKGF